MELLIPLIKSFLSFISEIGIFRIRKFLTNNFFERDKFYSWLQADIDKLQSKLDRTLSEPYKTSLIFFKLGLASNNEKYFRLAVMEATRAFNLAATVREKCESMIIILVNVMIIYDNPESQYKVLLNEFICDNII